MAQNKIKQFRTKLKLSQRELAERAGTSQQQIQRIEAGKISTSLETARAICVALGKPFEAVFPDAAKGLVAYGNEAERSGYLDSDALEKLSETGIEADVRAWYLKVQFHGVDKARIYRIDPRTYRRLYGRVQSEGESGSPMSFVVFDTLTHRIAMNLAEVVTCQFQFEPMGAPKVEASKFDSAVRIYPVGGSAPISFDVEPDEPEDDGIGQLGHVFFMVEMAADFGDRYRIIDQDGEHAFVRAGSIATFEAPLCLVEESEYEEEEEAED